MKLSEKLSKVLGATVVFDGGRFIVFKDNIYITRLSMLQALSLIEQDYKLGGC